MHGTIQVKGLREFTRALKKADSGLVKAMKSELKEAMEPVRLEAESRGARYAQIGPYKIVPYGSGNVFVRQGMNTVTGRRPDFGALQMRRVLIPALVSKEGEILEAFEDVVENVNRRAGL
jgi:hypothetical protein